MFKYLRLFTNLYLGIRFYIARAYTLNQFG
jgi:hypothetical protein